MTPRKKSSKTAANLLTPRQWVLLLMVDENTDIDEASGEIYQYFHGEDNFNSDFLVAFQKDPVRLWEVGDREAMRGLLDDGFISAPFQGEYNFVTTPLGHACALACLQNAPGTPLPENKERPTKTRGRPKRATSQTPQSPENPAVLHPGETAPGADGGFSPALPPSSV